MENKAILSTGLCPSAKFCANPLTISSCYCVTSIIYYFSWQQQSIRLSVINVSRRVMQVYKNLL